MAEAYVEVVRAWTTIAMTLSQVSQEDIFSVGLVHDRTKYNRSLSIIFDRTIGRFGDSASGRELRTNKRRFV